MGNRCRLWTAICHASSKWCGYPGLRAHNPFTSPITQRSRRTYNCGVKQPLHWYSSSLEETRAKSGTVTRSLNRPDNHLFPTNRILISKDSSAQVESRVAQDAMANSTDILWKMLVEGANTTIERSEFSEMLNTLSLWENILGSKTSQIPTNLEDYHSQWIYLLKTFPINGLSKHQFQNLLNPLTYEVSTISAHFIDFSKLFWPFIYELCDNNQKLAIVGMTGESMNQMNQKTTFFEELSKIQNMKIPADENKIIYSFDDEELVRGMHRTGLETFDKDFVKNGSHLFTKDEREEITRVTDAALDLINSTLPEVYKAINRLVGCIAFYKSQSRVHMGGTVSSAIGLIWLDPSTQKPWSIAFYAEQIVHEFIHTSLFYADLVHGMFRDPSRLSEAKVMSAIRRQMRDYDTSLHAAYVSAGLVTFHARAGYSREPWLWQNHWRGV
ncbi:hypothetical protein FSP39_010185 [Pinctada imbricata]|uniref:Uncharacterized protein n=1 Tax=Pinctada imbricata TaxID=66713 RepID=A0AA88YIF3_PINIB|nr:hypothetical protein FSP39_010185 [Pinctada imbricata]